ncbi:hypothetical protein LIZ98_09990, partial [Caldibacillus sp. 210928-DFI.2.18]|uniref:hypothetical protein n=1 Tax=Caldibacillus sp. 210928-DFI.2.18 TaxID=2883264 RepID=UPI001D063ECB
EWIQCNKFKNKNVKGLEKKKISFSTFRRIAKYLKTLDFLGIESIFIIWNKRSKNYLFRVYLSEWIQCNKFKNKNVKGLENSQKP